MKYQLLFKNPRGLLPELARVRINRSTYDLGAQPKVETISRNGYFILRVAGAGITAAGKTRADAQQALAAALVTELRDNPGLSRKLKVKHKLMLTEDEMEGAYAEWRIATSKGPRIPFEKVAKRLGLR